MKVLLDTCVVVDVLQKREPFYQNAMDIFLSISNRELEGVLTAKSLTDIYYIIRRSLHNEMETRKYLNTLFVLFDVEDTFSIDCQLALQSKMKDYEDAIMVETALRIGVDCIVTRNIKDYELSTIPVLSPEQLLAQLLAQLNNDD